MGEILHACAPPKFASLLTLPTLPATAPSLYMESGDESADKSGDKSGDGASGTTYQGPRNAHGERHGTGVWSHSDGRRYAGEWRDGRRHGQGEMRYADGTIYCGEYASGLRDGHGRVEDSSGFWYEGGWKGGKMSGSGHMRSTRGMHGLAVYEGTFVDGKLSGKGKMEFGGDTGDAMTYEGEWLDGKRHGRGVEVCRGLGTITTEASSYDGEWKADLRHGLGTHYATDDQIVYRGEWRHGRCVSWNYYRVRQFVGWCICRIAFPAFGSAILACAIVLAIAVLFAAPST